MYGKEEYRDASILCTNYDRLAVTLLEKFAGFINYQGKFGILSTTTDAPFQNNVINIIKEELKKPEYDEMELVDIVYGNDEPQQSMTEVENLIQKYPDLQGIITPKAVGTAAAAQAVESKGCYDRVVIYGNGTPNQMRSYIKKGIVPGSLFWNTKRTGYVAAHYVIGLLRGEYKTKKGYTFNVPEYGETAVHEQSVIYAGPPLALTKDNVDKYDF
ncbi:MAG: substrate-binding domain-containing protein [Atribacterota bacterium]